jgi:hypothetical protein
MELDMDDLDRALTHALQDAFQMTQQQEDAAWREFIDEQLPEKQAWHTFSIVMDEAEQRLLQAMEWAHWITARAA